MEASSWDAADAYGLVMCVSCQLCAEENLVLMADEVYQTNVYIDDRPFLSFRKVRHPAIHHN